MFRRELRPGYTQGQRWLEVACTALFFGLTAHTLARLTAIVWLQTPPSAAFVIAAGFIGGLLFSDFISGFVHWLADNWGNANWPILGTGFIRPFREHHHDPKEITHHGFFELQGSACIIATPTFFWGMQVAEANPAWALFTGVFWLSVAWWVLGTNLFHAWAHVDEPPRWVTSLQNARLILSPADHQRHHTAPFNKSYCITTGWFNAPLRWLRFFEILEWTVTAVTRIEPAHRRGRAAYPRGSEAVD